MPGSGNVKDLYVCTAFHRTRTFLRTVSFLSLVFMSTGTQVGHNIYSQHLFNLLWYKMLNRWSSMFRMRVYWPLLHADDAVIIVVHRPTWEQRWWLEVGGETDLQEAVPLSFCRWRCTVSQIWSSPKKSNLWVSLCPCDKHFVWEQLSTSDRSEHSWLNLD